MTESEIIGEWVNVFSDHARQAAENSDTPSHAHLIDHCRRVWHNASDICKRLGGDLEVLAAASFLHDLGRHEGFIIHGEKSAELAEPILEAEGFPKDKIPLVLEAVSLHDYQTPPDKRVLLESRILYDADKMDAFGAIGVKRHILYYFGSGESPDISGIIDDNLKVKWESLHFKQSREIAKDDFEYIIDFFERLGRA